MLYFLENSFEIKMSLEGNQAVDSELEKFLTVEKVKTQFHEQVHHITDVCWDKCIDKPGSKLDGKTQACMINCVERFIDASLVLTNRFAHLLQGSRS
ncbi:mitochondrial import inner membrane translocase subunit Tim8 A [Trichonephila inaurata madagascariensis]|uniref:Mitochondrial import inner membrane translocase subunit n=1 Tax=Trichonephila inaurata madagascariensis TaxID=2747483 RepID=A0A8X7CF58_9ARAC|nr:mitochondrial import inner membrane translocase subunit Tim8 A [Trichonephila inaurata madagascariensis]